MKIETCRQCGSERFEPGRLAAYYTAKFIPTGSTWWQRMNSRGATVRAKVCRDCGFVHLFVLPDELDELIDHGHTRCRNCRHILRGLSQPRCPECGEPI